MNDRPLSPALARRLAAYSATVGVALAAVPAASGQIVSHDYVPDIVSGSQDPPLDFDDDGVVDVVLREVVTTSGCARGLSYAVSFVAPAGGNAMNGLLGYNGPFSGTKGGLSRLQAGDVVGPAIPPQGFYRTGVAIRFTYCSSEYFYPFADQGGFAGFRFVAGDGQLHYGWMRLRGENVSITVYAYGYESTPNTPVVAGAKTVVAEGSVDQTVFPPEGGRLVYTATFSNRTDEPLSLDLWVEADLDGTNVVTRRLTSFTIQPGTTVSRSVPMRVIASAPAGTYDVRFRLGDFATQQFLTFERFAITKEAPAGEAASAALFELEALPGDLFADATTASAALPTTHVLSAPAPNPTDGRAALTLEVAETQAVRVALHDALGREVALLYDGTLAAGTPHRLVVEGSALPVGVYAVRAVGATFADVRTLTLTR
jgi:hypothetical protein